MGHRASQLHVGEARVIVSIWSLNMLLEGISAVL